MTREIEARLKISAIDKTGAAMSAISSKMAQVSARAKAYNSQMAAYNRSASAYNAAVDRGLLARVRDFGRRQVEVDRLEAAMSRTVALVAGGYVAKEAYGEFAQLDRQMNRIGITAGATEKATADASNELFRLSKQVAILPEDAAKGLDTLVASGKTLEEAMSFLPSVLKAAQASGAEVDAMANTALKTASALAIPTDRLEAMFDIMVTQGKAGQFELKDMAQQVPALANSFASLGYKGEKGLITLGAVLQTLREDTADAGAAATQAQNIFGKMFSEETANKFKKMGINLPKQLKEAKKNGEGLVEAFVRISKEATKGDMSKLPLLFSDQELRLGMQSLMTSQESFRKYMAAGLGKDVMGAVNRDVQRITKDAQSSIDRLSASWTRFVSSTGKSIQPVVSAVMDSSSEASDMTAAARKALEAKGLTGLNLYWELYNKIPIGPFPASPDYERLARQGGYMPADRPDLERMKQIQPFGYEVLGRYPERPVSKRQSVVADFMAKNRADADARQLATDAWERRATFEAATAPRRSFFSVVDKGNKGAFDAPAARLKASAAKIAAFARPEYVSKGLPQRTIPIPTERPIIKSARIGASRDIAADIPLPRPKPSNMERRMERDLPRWKLNNDGLTPETIRAAAAHQMGRLADDMKQITSEFEKGGAKIKEGGDHAGQTLNEAGDYIARKITEAAAQAVQTLQNAQINIKLPNIPSASQPIKVNANTGKSNTFVQSRDRQ